MRIGVELISEYLRPWKLITLCAGMAFLLYGAMEYHISDWDVGICFVMGLLTYFTAPWSVRVLLLRRWRWFPLAGFWAWFSVDGAYWLYHTAMGNEMLREANFYTSLPWYFAMGCFWLWNGSVREFWNNLKGMGMKS